MLTISQQKYNDHQNQSLGFNLTDHLELRMVNLRKDTPSSFDNNQLDKMEENINSSKNDYLIKIQKKCEDSFLGQVDIPQTYKHQDESSFRNDEKQSINTFHLDKKNVPDKDLLGINLENANTHKSNLTIAFMRSRSQNIWEGVQWKAETKLQWMRKAIHSKQEHYRMMRQTK